MTEPSLPKMALRRAVVVAIVAAGRWVVIWLSPWLLSAVTIAGGVFQHTPIVLTLSAATFVFAAATTGLLRFNEWQLRRSPRDKLQFRSGIFAIGYVRGDSGQITGIDNAQAIAVLQNHAMFSISYIVDEISSSIEGHINTRPAYDTKGGLIAPNSETWYRDAPIALSMTTTPPLMSGRMKLKLRYGLPGKEIYRLQKDVNMFTGYDNRVGAYLVTNYMDAPT